MSQITCNNITIEDARINKINAIWFFYENNVTFENLHILNVLMENTILINSFNTTLKILDFLIM